MDRIKKKKVDLQRRHLRLRNKLSGTAARPRLAVCRSLQNIYCQIIDDEAGRTLVAASTLSPELKGSGGYGGNVKAAVAVGELIAKKAGEKQIKQVVFDRGGRRYHGRVKALAEAARKAGLVF